MQIKAVKTHKITPKSDTLKSLIDKYIKNFSENQILAITSKIVSICEGGVEKIGKVKKDDLIKREAEFYLPRTKSKYNFFLTIKRSLLVPSAGIDESNANGYYVLWPSDPQKTANTIRSFLCKKFKIKHAGVVITDSKTSPLRWGVTGAAIAHSGFYALNDLIGKPDIFGRKLMSTKVNVADAVASSAVVVMGESNEQTPLAVISDVPFVKFAGKNPTKKEIEGLKIALEDDLYAPILTKVKWRKGGKKNKN